MSRNLTLPGLIDCHVHFREPGLTHKEDFETGMRSALAGGITTVLDMPNTNPPTCTVAALEDKIARVKKIRKTKSEIRNIDVRFFFGITQQEHLRELEKVMATPLPQPLCAGAGSAGQDDLKKYVPGVKLYFGQSTGEQMVDPGVVQDVFKLCRELDLPLVAHCEDERIIRENHTKYAGQGIAAHSKIRSIEAAVKAVTRAIDLARKFGTHLHIAHVSTAHEVKLIRQAKRSGIRITCEVAPHHLFLSTEDYATLDTLVKVNPPLRSKEHCSALFEGLLDGTIDCIASDHAPHTLEEKGVRNPPERFLTPWDAPSGVPGVETTLPLLLSCVFGDGPIDAQGTSRLPTEGSTLNVTDIIRLLYEAPNRIFRLGKPAFDPGKQEGTILVNPLANWVIAADALHSKCGWTPYEGWRVKGKFEIRSSKHETSSKSE